MPRLPDNYPSPDQWKLAPVETSRRIEGPRNEADANRLLLETAALIGKSGISANSYRPQPDPASTPTRIINPLPTLDRAQQSADVTRRPRKDANRLDITIPKDSRGNVDFDKLCGELALMPTETVVVERSAKGTRISSEAPVKPGWSASTARTAHKAASSPRPRRRRPAAFYGPGR